MSMSSVSSTLVVVAQDLNLYGRYEEVGEEEEEERKEYGVDFDSTSINLRNGRVIRNQEIKESFKKMRGMNPIQVLFLVIFIAIANGCSCDTSTIFHLSRKLAGQNPEQNQKEVSPSPAPSRLSHGVADVTDERCLDSVTRRCSVEASHMTACVNYSDGSLKSSFLLVQNDGEDPLEVNVTIVDVKVTLPSMQISRHQAKKINISAILEGSPSIFLNTGKENCTIPLGSQDREGKVYKQFLADSFTHFTPIYGVYFLFLIALIVGGAWAWCKLAKSDGHLDGVRYQEIEMEQQSGSKTVNNKVETVEGWDEDWDDEWGEIKEVKSSNGKKTDVSVNTGKDELGNDWED